jgi:hypothetical protein
MMLLLSAEGSAKAGQHLKTDIQGHRKISLYRLQVDRSVGVRNADVRLERRLRLLRGYTEYAGALSECLEGTNTLLICLYQPPHPYELSIIRDPR